MKCLVLLALVGVAVAEPVVTPYVSSGYGAQVVQGGYVPYPSVQYAAPAYPVGPLYTGARYYGGGVPGYYPGGGLIGGGMYGQPVYPAPFIGGGLYGPRYLPGGYGPRPTYGSGYGRRSNVEAVANNVA